MSIEPRHQEEDSRLPCPHDLILPGNSHLEQYMCKLIKLLLLQEISADQFVWANGLLISS